MKRMLSRWLSVVLMIAITLPLQKCEDLKQDASNTTASSTMTTSKAIVSITETAATAWTTDADYGMTLSPNETFVGKPSKFDEHVEEWQYVDSPLWNATAESGNYTSNVLSPPPAPPCKTCAIKPRDKRHQDRPSKSKFATIPAHKAIATGVKSAYRLKRIRRSAVAFPSATGADMTYPSPAAYRRRHRYRYYEPSQHPAVTAWDRNADFRRRYLRFPPTHDAPPPPPSFSGWAPSGPSVLGPVPQSPYAFHHSPQPAMGPRSPRLVFRDPVDSGTLQAPFGPPSGLQDLLISPADEGIKDGWVDPDVTEGKRNKPCATGSCEFLLTCWMASGYIESTCGGFLYVCCDRNSAKQQNDNFAINTNRASVPVDYGPVTNDPSCGVSVVKQQGAQRRIVGGDEAGFGSFPWQAYIRIGSSRCGGSLVNRYHVVTAGHCVARASARQVQVTLGDYVINSAVEPLPAYTFGVRKISVHPYFKFTPQADRFDVAVLKLDRPVQYMPHIAPICLPEKGEDFLGQYGWAAGWGALQAGSRLRPKTLQAVDVPIIDNRQCEKWHKSNGINVIIYDEMMCAGYREGSKDSCQGDSGGPLMLEKTGRWYLIGIVSAGYSCAQRGQPGIYHRVPLTVDWISYVINSQ
ncbi:proclotting enzyme-like isoform X5 [Daktulosphaira vitifoliae]|uniref:proclotting enzyme-like isoform X1 n=1 Tax=Daktulosphaira vitifoliae TaxID=58002 RepID=UPI0021A9FAAE|nr:proclotting enzyme-like isoform X1 [Daktulosphaira vitifoliae]XP_050531483.1 proclotting enzyme-like isoform X2 [Daktulosphaira vitifoliae]XP_050531484.1 proclotting enzyme-like isoform X3 [Daktulosphaira vitifoliae]XP_050531485.1 proclotting enzyme-like isoform X4 [Daktulosphaira vitifoliae]XP_050531486.1 proclotting enzyme-like isoform X5 [Daktulosphaira vitifoliae]